MSHILHTYRRLLCLLALSVLGAVPVPAAAQQGLSFSITPTIFDMAAMPGQAWTSSVKVVNNNPYPLTVYAVPVSFVPQGERGHGAFVPVPEERAEETGTTLASWMDITNEPIEIPAESSVAVPVAIAVPQDASPGGHYAAVMIGTKPPVTEGKMSVKTSQIISALFFMRIAGDVVELGEVRTFRSERRFAGSPEMAFTVRFENKGTVHLQPQGEIRITNMWGKERGIIPINQETNFGNVLPASTRLFSFSWKGASSLTDIGRYRADLTLAYGLEERKFITRSTTFFVIPLKPLLTALAFLAFAIGVVTWSVRTYIRYMLRLSGFDPATTGTVRTHRYIPKEGDVALPRRVRAGAVAVPVPIAKGRESEEQLQPYLSLATLIAPVTRAWQELRVRLTGVRGVISQLRVALAFVVQYRTFFIAALGIAAVLVGTLVYVRGGTVSDRTYEVTIGDTDPTTISSEEIMRDRAPETSATPADSTDARTTESVGEKRYTLEVVNAGAVPGSGGAVEAVLIDGGFAVDALSVDLESPRARSVIIYDPAVEAEAKQVSDLLGGVLLSAYVDPAAALPAIVVYLGADGVREP